jgi:cell division protein FtsB
VSHEIRLNLRAAFLCLVVLLAATIVGTGWNTWHIEKGAFDRENLWEEVEQLRQANNKTNGRIDYFKRNVNKRFSEIEKRAGK